MPFDSESGQLFTESVASHPRKDEDDMVYVDLLGHVRARPKSHISSKGTRTLYKMAMSTVLRNLDLLYFDLLKALPVPILEQIWKAINRKDLAGIRMWKLFAPILGPAGNRQLMTRSVVKRPWSFSHAISQGLSADSAWLTSLTLDAIPLTMADYVHVSRLPNLCSLAVLFEPRRDTEFSDRVLRAWASDAKTGSFSRLRYVLVSGNRHVTEQSLSYLSSFQALQLFCAHNCRFYTGSRPIPTGDTCSKSGQEWQDLPHGAFRRFLRTKAATFDRNEYQTPFPSSFHLYTSHCQREREGLKQDTPPMLLMTLLPKSRHDERATLMGQPLLHCFERVANFEVCVQDTKQNNIKTMRKRRKLNGKSKALDDLLEGLS